jgi:hypothetical protein
VWNCWLCAFPLEAHLSWQSEKPSHVCNNSCRSVLVQTVTNSLTRRIILVVYIHHYRCTATVNITLRISYPGKNSLVGFRCLPPIDIPCGSILSSSLPNAIFCSQCWGMKGSVNPAIPAQVTCVCPYLLQSSSCYIVHRTAHGVTPSHSTQSPVPLLQHFNIFVYVSLPFTSNSFWHSSSILHSTISGQFNRKPYPNIKYS